MKISDFFSNLPWRTDGNVSFLYLTPEQNRAIAIAVNNHDRLVEENNRLREALKATIKSSWGVINSDDEDFLEKVDLHKNLEGELSRAEELLSEIGGDL